MPVEKHISRGIRALLIGIMSAFAVALVGPTESTIADVNNAATAAQEFGGGASMAQAMFLLGIEVVFVSFVFYVGYRVVKRD